VILGAAVLVDDQFLVRVIYGGFFPSKSKRHFDDISFVFVVLYCRKPVRSVIKSRSEVLINYNALAAAPGEPVLPPLPTYPPLPSKMRMDPPEDGLCRQRHPIAVRIDCKIGGGTDDISLYAGNFVFHRSVCLRVEHV